MSDNLPPNFYLASYLKKAGIRFEVNTVDTIIRKGFGIGSFILVLLLLFFNCSGLFKISLNNYSFIAVNALGTIYLIYVCVRLLYYRSLRHKLRKDPAPITAEAYALVIFDEDFNLLHLIFKRFSSKLFVKSAIIYKESGAFKPRFFTGSVRSFCYPKLNLGQVVRVYPHRKNVKLYTVDDTSAFQTVSPKAKAFTKLNISSNLETGTTNSVCRKNFK